VQNIENERKKTPPVCGISLKHSSVNLFPHCKGLLYGSYPLPSIPKE